MMNNETNPTIQNALDIISMLQYEIEHEQNKDRLKELLNMLEEYQEMLK